MNKNVYRSLALVTFLMGVTEVAFVPEHPVFVLNIMC